MVSVNIPQRTHGTCSRRGALCGLAALIGYPFTATAERVQTGTGVDPATDECIQALSTLTGRVYLARRNKFLAAAAPLPEYPFEPGRRDPRYRLQYLILAGWLRNADLYRRMRAREDAANVEFMSISAAGFHPFWNETRVLSAREWRYDGLPYAWEHITKFAPTGPRWRTMNSVNIIRGFPHVDSIDPLLIAAPPEDDRSWRETRLRLLAEMPVAGLEARLAQETDFYRPFHPVLEDALRRRR